MCALVWLVVSVSSSRTVQFWPVRPRLVLGLAALLVGAIGVPVVAAGIDDSIDAPATATAQAQRLAPPASDVVSIYNSSKLRASVADAAVAAARQAGASIAFGRSASVGMVGVYRGSAPVQLPASGFAYPMGTTVLPSVAVGALMGGDVSALLAPDALVMGATTAGLRGAQAGDVLQLVASDGSVVAFRVAAVLLDARVGGAELLMSPEGADRLGITDLSRALLWNPSSRAAMDAALAANGLVSTSIRIRRSWDPPDPDDTLGMARTKALLGEFSYRVNSDGTVSQDDAWVSASLPPGRVLLNDVIPISARCHNIVDPALRAALAEVAAAGLGGTINVGDANTTGGCHVARFNRLTPDNSLGFLSRHSWGMALDTNTQGSCQGCVPDFSKTAAGCTTVRIFRKYGFAWGGNFLTPDGMHFEYVGERRDLQAYPSRFCPNPAALALSDVESGIDTFFAGDGMIVGER
jgi:D-alanyl-D-alanine carboxypeptidase